LVTAREAAFVAERPDVQLEALEFDAGLFRDVVENQRGEVGLAGFRAQAGEFGNFHVDHGNRGARRRIGEGFEGLGGWVVMLGVGGGDAK
jgi:hypothetical protein